MRRMRLGVLLALVLVAVGGMIDRLEAVQQGIVLERPVQAPDSDLVAPLDISHQKERAFLSYPFRSDLASLGSVLDRVVYGYKGSLADRVIREGNIGEMSRLYFKRGCRPVLSFKGRINGWENPRIEPLRVKVHEPRSLSE